MLIRFVMSLGHAYLYNKSIFIVLYDHVYLWVTNLLTDGSGILVVSISWWKKGKSEW